MVMNTVHGTKSKTYRGGHCMLQEILVEVLEVQVHPLFCKQCHLGQLGLFNNVTIK
jgi:hypothetical protein